MTSRPQEGAPKVVASADGVWKLYGSFVALQDVNLALVKGEVHILLGENGAGKSTLVGILIGTHMADKGTVSINGKVVHKYSPHRARGEGINAVLQDSSLAPSLTVAENYWLGQEVTTFGLLSKTKMRAEAARSVDRLGVHLDVDRPAS